jgi:hypothetical protein
MKDGLLKIKFGFNEPKEIEGVKIEVKWCLTILKKTIG